MMKDIKTKFRSCLVMLRQTNRRKSILLGLIIVVIAGFATIFTSGINLMTGGAANIRQMTLSRMMLAGLVILAVFGFVMMKVTGQPGFCKTCHYMDRYHASWDASSHNEVNCMKCHSEPGLLGYAKGKIVAPAHLINYVLGRAPTKPNATVTDISCLRPDCHNAEELSTKKIKFRGINYTHEKHIGKVLDGITISCRTCHNRFEGTEHFSVTADVCFTCHFLKNAENEEKLVQTGCLGCHEIPGTMQSGSMTIDHSEYASFGASCEKSCHKREFKKDSEVPENICLNCHDYKKSQHPDQTELHEIHTNCEKVECFECHGEVSHGQDQSASASTRMTCEKCHNQAHDAQLRVYSANEHPQGQEDSSIVSPMFLTHVECTGCHTQQSEPFSGDAFSFGKVAKAVASACDTCHEPGTGRDYIPLWQGKTKELYEQVSAKLKNLEDLAQSGMDAETARGVKSKIDEAAEILRLVEADGSWGVHNLKYTEALLLKADKIVTEAQ